MKHLQRNRSHCVVLIFVFLWVVVSSAHAQRTPIRIGVSLSFSGKYAEPSEMIRFGYRLWVDQVNARGGLLERPVELIVYDDQSNLAKVRTNYLKLLKEDHVELLLSPYGSPATLVASEVSENQGYVMIACAAGSEKVYSRGFQYLFGLYAPADRFCIGFLDLLARKGLNRAGIVFENSTFHESILTGFKRWSDIFGVQVLFIRGFDREGARFDPIVTELKSQDIHALVFSSYPPEGYAFIKSLQRHQYRPDNLFLTITSIHPEFANRVGRFADGVFGPSQWEPIESIPYPGTKQFVAEFKKATGRLPSYHASAAFSAGQILEQAVTATRSLKHDPLRDFIFRLDTVTVIGRFKVDETGHQVGHNPMVIQWQRGKKEIVYPAKMRTAEPIFGP